MPSERSRRWASTVKPPTETSAMSSMPTVASASTIVVGLSGLLPCADTTLCGVDTAARMLCGSVPNPRASNSTVTWLGAVTWPGTTRANSSSRLCGFCTMPTTRRDTPAAVSVLPMRRCSSAATPLVTATWPGPAG